MTWMDRDTRHDDPSC